MMPAARRAGPTSARDSSARIGLHFESFACRARECDFRDRFVAGGSDGPVTLHSWAGAGLRRFPSGRRL
ncbi:hypothetical protein FRACA_410029 [Frankia canadensis]|uniref:Uncharacterized protein n=1 Tax=Frankia canadensis TaxID=1836972 RepID=A0A2I2KWX1_9ACTN|nr:hypothetical protein FRACA_410029 [Frankia canadensis]SOU57445.1 hypothetical protein FRACA_410029 [Frankia canadensis]